MNGLVIENFSRLRLINFLIPIVLLALLVSFIFLNTGFSVKIYADFQKNTFYTLNHYLSQYPNLMYEMTQLGDALVLYSMISVLIIYSPKVFEVILVASFISLLVSFGLKNIFSVPRPAAMFINNDFTILGKVLKGRSSFPSGHSMTIFMTLIILMFAFTPRTNFFKIIWYVAVVIIGACIAISRVGVGAHYPLDVVGGCLIGYVIALLGIFVNRKYNLWDWLRNKKYYPFLLLICLSLITALIFKILKENLIVYYISIIVLIITLFKTTQLYVKR